MNSLELKNWFGRKSRMVDYKRVYPTNRKALVKIDVRMKYRDAVANCEVDYTDLTGVYEIMDELMNVGHPLKGKGSLKCSRDRIEQIADQSCSDDWGGKQKLWSCHSTCLSMCRDRVNGLVSCK